MSRAGIGAHLCALGVCAAAFVLAAAPAHAAPCGGVTVELGEVRTGDRLPLRALQTEDGIACTKAIAAAVAARPEIKSVTVRAEMIGSQASVDAAKAGAQTVAHALSEAGVLISRVGTVLVAAPQGRPPGVSVTYVARGSHRSTAQLWRKSGKVWWGRHLDERVESQAGALLSAGHMVETGHTSVALLQLIDGSRIWLGENSALRIGQTEGRRVRVELVRGLMEARVPEDGGMIARTPMGTATTQEGSAFRLDHGEKMTRLAVYRGTLNFSARRGNVFVADGEGTRVDHNAQPEKATALLLGPKIVGPRMGRASVGDTLSWEAVPHADRYHIEFAADATFTDRIWWLETKLTKSLINDAHTSGKWFWRVTALTEDGTTGHPSKVYAFIIP